MTDELERCLAAAEERLDRAMFEKESLDLQCDALAKEIDRLRIEIAVGEMMANDFDDSTLGENMTTSKLLANALNRQDLGVRRSFERLEDDEKAELEAMYRRHAAACRKSNMRPEPSFIREAITDVVFEHSSYRRDHPVPVNSDRSWVMGDEKDEDPMTNHSSLITSEAVGELVQTGFEQFGGEGEADPVVLRMAAGRY